jgi:hypothetical protein
MRIRTVRKDDQLAAWVRRCPSDEYVLYIMQSLLREWGFPVTANVILDRLDSK